MVKPDESGTEASRSTVPRLPAARTPVLTADQDGGLEPTQYLQFATGTMIE
jgi:hypothetical protein